MQTICTSTQNSLKNFTKGKKKCIFKAVKVFLKKKKDIRNFQVAQPSPSPNWPIAVCIFAQRAVVGPC